MIFRGCYNSVVVLTPLDLLILMLISALVLGCLGALFINDRGAFWKRINEFIALTIIFIGIAIFALLASPFVFAAWLYARHDERRQRSSTPDLYP